MKKTLSLLILVILTTSLYGQTQWYNRQYGVNNISELSEAQLKMALHNAETKVKTGRILTFVGIGTTLLGGILYVDGMSSAGDSWDEFWQNAGQAGGGLLLMIAGSGTIALGLPFWIIGANRKNSIEVALVKFKTTSFSGYNQPTCLGYSQSKPFGLSLKINF